MKNERIPNTLNPVLAEVTHIEDSFESSWYEIIHYDTEANKWCWYSSNDVVDCSEYKILRWKYCSKALSND